MPQITPIARSAGKISIDNAGGTLVAISDQAQSFSIDGVEFNASSFFTAGSEWANAVAGKRSWRATIRFYRTAAVGEAWKVLQDWGLGTTRPVARTLQIDTPDSTTGNDRFTGEVMITGLTPLAEMDAGSNEPQVVTLNLMGHGELVRTTIV